MAKAAENTKKIVPQADETAIKARAERLKLLRSLSHLTREELCTNTPGLNANTFKGWELGRFGGLTKEGAERVIARVAQKNVVCSLEWLLGGTGPEPMVVTFNPAIEITDRAIQKELSMFQALFHTILYAEIKDSLATSPYHFGDIVAGVKLSLENIPALTGQICLLETAEYETIVMKLLKSLGNNRFLLGTLSGDAQLEAALLSAARITRVYRA